MSKVFNYINKTIIIIFWSIITYALIFSVFTGAMFLYHMFVNYNIYEYTVIEVKGILSDETLEKVEKICAEKNIKYSLAKYNSQVTATYNNAKKLYWEVYNLDLKEGEIVADYSPWGPPEDTK